MSWTVGVDHLASLPGGVLLLAKVTLVLGVGALLALPLRRRSAAARHAVWTLVLAGCLALPLLAPVAPRLELPVPAPAARSAAGAAPTAPLAADGSIVDEAPDPSVPTTVEPRSSSPGPGEAVRRAARAQPVVLAAVWLLGTVLLLAWTVAGHLGLRRLARSSTPLASAAWAGLLREAAAATGVERPIDLRACPALAAPITWGARRPRVLFPSQATEWSAELRRAALLHELAHVARVDYLTQLFAVIACALYWFHPGVWMALRRLRRESERACDDRILELGTPAAEYAAHLLAVAREVSARRLSGTGVAVGMARPSTFEHRLLAVLDDTAPRRALGPAGRLAGALALLVVLVPLAGLRAVSAASGRDESGPLASVGQPGCWLDRGDSLACEVDAAAGEALTLELSETGADVRIVAWDEPRVRLEGWFSSPRGDANFAGMHRDGGGVLVRTWYGGSRRGRSSDHRLELWVPRHFDVRLESAGGDVSIDGVEGTFRGSTGGGEIVLTDLRGHAELSTGGGEIRVADCRLSGLVTTGAGGVTFSRVTGGLEATSGTGPVVRSDGSPEDRDEPDDRGEQGDRVDTDGELLIDRGTWKPDERRPRPPGGAYRVTKDGGDIRLEEAPRGAEVSTGGGAIAIGWAGDDVSASTGGGDVTIGPVAGSVRAGTGAGDIRVTLVDAGGAPQDVDLWSGSGRVVLVLPAGFDGTIELETAYTEERLGGETRIESDFALDRETTERWDDREGTPRRYVRGRATLGAGQGHVVVRTVNGDIELRRGA
jgi:beta-lactamase regulating signal transducer with metallopeptidase domain